MKYRGESTKAVHVGNTIDHKMVTRSKTMPIYETSVFTYDSLEQLDDYLLGNKNNYMYSRLGNPNGRALEKLVATLEMGEDAAVVSSGMAAISTALIAMLSAGDHLIVSKEAYGGTLSLVNKELSRLGISCSLVDINDEVNLINHIRPNTKAILTEITSNPLLTIANIPLISKISKQFGLLLMVDNTFMTPILYKPLLDGADMVIHSTTKYINGHSDVTGGIIVSNEERIAKCKRVLANLGTSINPLECWLTYRGAKTLSLRMKQHSSNAIKLAEYLETHKKIKKVFYPGVPSHKQYTLANDMFKKGYGGMLSFAMEDDLSLVDRMIKNFNMVKLAPSLAGLSTTISHPTKTSHRGFTESELKNIGISHGTIRVSVGIEDFEDIREDFHRTLESL